MTPEDLRAARFEEASRRYANDKQSIMGHMADIYETNWTPPEPVDPDLEAARIYANRLPATPEIWNARVLAFRAGCTRGREGAKELVEALEYVQRMSFATIGDGWTLEVGYRPEIISHALAAAKGERV